MLYAACGLGGKYLAHGLCTLTSPRAVVPRPSACDDRPSCPSDSDEYHSFTRRRHPSARLKITARLPLRLVLSPRPTSPMYHIPVGRRASFATASYPVLKYLSIHLAPALSVIHAVTDESIDSATLINLPWDFLYLLNNKTDLRLTAREERVTRYNSPGAGDLQM